MATYYWVGGSGSWDTTSSTNWSLSSGGAGGAGIPTVSDDVVFNSSSGTGTVDIGGASSTNANCNDWTIQAGCLLSFTGGSPTQVIVGRNCIIASGITFLQKSTSNDATITISSNYTTSAIIDCKSVLTGFSVSANNPNTTLNADLTLTPSSATTSGTFTVTANANCNLNNFTVTSRVLFVNSGTTLNFGTSGQIILTGNNTTVAVITSTGFPATTILGTVKIISNYSGSTGTRTFNFTGLTEGNALDVFTGTGTGLSIGTAGTDIISITGNVNSLNLTGFNGTLSNTARTLFGSLTIPASGGTYTAGANGTTFSASSGTQVITTNGRTLDFPVAKGDTDSTIQLAGALTLGSVRAFTFNGGTLNLNNFTLLAGSFSAATTNRNRQIQFGTGSITTISSGTAINIVGNTTAGTFTYTGTPTINISNNSATATTVTLSSGFTETNALSVNYTIGTYALTDTTAVYKNLNFTGFAGTVPNAARTIYGNLTIPASGGTYTAGTNAQSFLATSGTQTITANGRSLSFPITLGDFSSASTTFAISNALTLATNGTLTHRAGTLQLPSSVTTTVTTFASAGPVSRTIRSSIPGTRATISQASGTVTIFTGTITDIAKSGAATYNSYGTDGGNNTGISFLGGYTGALYWVGGTGNWGTTNTKFSLSSGGAATALTPDASTPVIVNASSGSPTITLQANVACASLTTTGATCTITGIGAPTISGDLTLSATTTWSGSGAISFNNSSTITTNGVSPTCNVTLSPGNYTHTLGSALTLGATRFFTLSGGTLNLNNFTLTAGLISANSPTTRQIQFGTSNITVTGSGASLFNIGGNNLTYTGTPTINISNNTATASTLAINTGFNATNAFDVNVTTGTYTLTDSSAVYRNLNFTGFAGTLSAQNRTLYGNLTIPASGGTYTATVNNTTFAATSGTQTITTNGRTIDFAIAKSGVGGTLQLAGALTINTAITFTFNSGTLDLNNFTLTTGLFQSNSTTARVLQFGTGNITITRDSSTDIQTITGTNLTVTGTPTFNVSNPGTLGTSLRLFPNFTEANAFNVNVTTGSFPFTAGGNTFKSLNFTGFTGNYLLDSGNQTFFGSLTFVSGMTVTTNIINTLFFRNTSGTATFTSAGKTLNSVSKDAGDGTLAFSGPTTISNTLTFSQGTLQLPASTTTTVGTFTTSGTALKYLTSSTSGTRATISSANNATVTYLSIKDSNATGGGIFDATGTANVNAGNNLGWLFGAGGGTSNFFLLF